MQYHYGVIGGDVGVVIQRCRTIVVGRRTCRTTITYTYATGYICVDKPCGCVIRVIGLVHTEGGILYWHRSVPQWSLWQKAYRN